MEKVISNSFPSDLWRYQKSFEKTGKADNFWCGIYLEFKSENTKEKQKPCEKELNFNKAYEKNWDYPWDF